MKVIIALVIVLLVVIFLKYTESTIGYIDVCDFIMESKVPECLTLSSTRKSLILRGHSVDEIRNMRNEYAVVLANTPLSSDFTNDYFIDKRDPTHRFCITRRVDALHSQSCIYVPGNNDYFYNKTLANQLFAKGYNFYAISFPNFGFASDTKCETYSTFSSIPGLYKYIDCLVEFYKIAQIDLLIGHSTGALISIGYAEYRNHHQTYVKRLVLSSPCLDWYGDPRATSYVSSVEFLKQIITPIGLFVRKFNLKGSIGAPNFTTCEEFNEMNFNPKYKSLVEIHTFPEWIRACTLLMRRIQGGFVNVKCPVDVLVSDKSVYWIYTDECDNTLDVAAIVKYSRKIGHDVRVNVIPNAVHMTFLRVSDITALLHL